MEKGFRYLRPKTTHEIFVKITTWTMNTSSLLLTAEGCKLFALVLPISTVNPARFEHGSTKDFWICDKLCDKIGLTVSPSRTYSVTIPPENLSKLFARALNSMVARISDRTAGANEDPAIRPIDITASRPTFSLPKSQTCPTSTPGTPHDEGVGAACRRSRIGEANREAK